MQCQRVSVSQGSAMPSYDSLFNAFVTILVTIDPPGLAPLFLAVTRGMNREERRQVSVRASVIGFSIMALFAIAGAMAAISGILLVSRLGSGNATAANGLEFDVIAAVVVGGTSLSGGRGSMLGTLLGVLVITLIGNGLVLLGINPFFQQVVRGLIIVIAVLANIQAIKRSMSRNKG